MLHRIQTITDTISQKPEVGIFGSFMGVALSPIELISLISAALGLLITIFTIIIKFMDLHQRIRDRKRRRYQKLQRYENIVIDGKTYQRVIEEDL